MRSTRSPLATRGPRALRTWRIVRQEGGSGSTLALAIIGATIAIAIALLGVVGAFSAHTRASVAADAAALAAADSASNRIPGDPCTRAGVVSTLHGGTLQSCTSTRTESHVTVSTDLGWFVITASARAGLPRQRLATFWQGRRVCTAGSRFISMPWEVLPRPPSGSTNLTNNEDGNSAELAPGSPAPTGKFTRASGHRFWRAADSSPDSCCMVPRYAL